MSRESKILFYLEFSCFLCLVYHQCSGCGEEYYCSRKCQKRDWKEEDHKIQCGEFKKLVTLVTNVRWKKLLPHFKIMKRTAEMPCYHGRTFAVDYLALKGNEWKTLYKSDDPCLARDYNILSVGCGDIRSLVYTITSLPNQFSGKLHVTMCDFDPFVMARNVLFLYMMVRCVDRSKVGQSLATLWYSLQISKDDYEFVMEALHALITGTAADQSLSQVTDGFISMPRDHIDALRQVWQGWVALECDCKKPGNISLHKERRKVIDRLHPQPIRDDIPEEQLPSYKKWKYDGIFTETPMELEQLPFYNPTLTGSQGHDPSNGSDPGPESFDLQYIVQPKDLRFKYCVMGRSEPFIVWDYEVVREHGYDDSLTTMYHAYVSQVIRKVMTFVNTQKRVAVTMTTVEFHNLKPEPVYDRVFTSTLADVKGVYPLLEFFGPFLRRDNEHAVLLVSTFSMENDAAGYLYGQDELTFRDRKIFMMAGEELWNLDNPWPLRFEPHPLDYHYDQKWFMRYLKTMYMGIYGNDKVPTGQQVLQCGDLKMRDVRVELNKVVPYRYTWAVREGAPPVKGYRYMEWYYPS